MSNFVIKPAFGEPFPRLDVPHAHDNKTIPRLLRYLEQRIVKRNQTRTDLQLKHNEFRNILSKIECENKSLKIENESLKAMNEQQKRKISTLEVHLDKSEMQIDNLLFKLNSANDAIKCLQQELKEKDVVINKRDIEKQRVMHKYKNKIQTQTDKIKKELETKMHQQHECLQKQVKEKENKLQLVKKILLEDDNGKRTTNETKKDSIPETPMDIKNDKHPNDKMPLFTGQDFPVSTEPANISKITVTTPEFNGTPLSRRGETPVVNPRYRRSRAAEMWLNHRPRTLVPLGTVFQPFMQHRRSVTQLTDPKEFTNYTSRYCLLAQGHDADGELETKLYKGDILPTSGGGAQIIFNDIEKLKQESPISSRKRFDNRS